MNEVNLKASGSMSSEQFNEFTQKQNHHHFYMTLICIFGMFVMAGSFWVVWSSVAHWDQSDAGRFSRCVESCGFKDDVVTRTGKDKDEAYRRAITSSVESNGCIEKCYVLVAGETEECKQE